MEGERKLHVAIVMDGNGRWAVQHGLPRVAGHRQGAQVVHDVVAAAPGLGVSALTVFAFSTENWKRPKEEVDFIMQLFVSTVTKWLPELMERGVKVRVIGNRGVLPGAVRTAVAAIEGKTASGSGLHLNVALNYGGRAEIVAAAREFSEACTAGTAFPHDLTEDRFSSYLWLAPDTEPDLVIRTGGERRVSNFLLWEMAYSELFFLDLLWPEFTPDTLASVLSEFRARDRRFGAL